MSEHRVAVLVIGQGYALLDKLRSTSDPAQRQRCLDDAAGPLFRAAADLAAPGTADGRESYVRGLLGVLAADMMGFYQPEGPEACCPFHACILGTLHLLCLICLLVICPIWVLQSLHAKALQVCRSAVL